MLIKDLETWKKIIEKYDGFIYNDFGTQFPGNSPTWNTTNFNKLHRTTCPYVNRMNHSTDGKFTKHYFQSRQEALLWLESNRQKDGYTLCKYCDP